MDIDILLWLSVANRLDNVESSLTKMEAMVSQISDNLDALVAQVAANSSALDSAIEVINSIAARIAAAGVDPEALAALTSELKLKDAALAEAILTVPPVV